MNLHKNLFVILNEAKQNEESLVFMKIRIFRLVRLCLARLVASSLKMTNFEFDILL